MANMGIVTLGSHESSLNGVSQQSRTFSFLSHERAEDGLFHFLESSMAQGTEVTCAPKWIFMYKGSNSFHLVDSGPGQNVENAWTDM